MATPETFDSSSHASSGVPLDQGPSGSRMATWAVLAGVAVIALQLLTFDMVMERHVREAEAQAAKYVTTTLQPRDVSALQGTLLASQ